MNGAAYIMSTDVGNYDVFRKICDQMLDVIHDCENRFIKAATLKNQLLSIEKMPPPPPESFSSNLHQSQ